MERVPHQKVCRRRVLRHQAIGRSQIKPPGVWHHAESSIDMPGDVASHMQTIRQQLTETYSSQLSTSARAAANGVAVEISCAMSGRQFERRTNGRGSRPAALGLGAARLMCFGAGGRPGKTRVRGKFCAVRGRGQRNLGGVYRYLEGQEGSRGRWARQVVVDSIQRMERWL